MKKKKKTVKFVVINSQLIIEDFSVISVKQKLCRNIVVQSRKKCGSWLEWIWLKYIIESKIKKENIYQMIEKTCEGNPLLCQL